MVKEDLCRSSSKPMLNMQAKQTFLCFCVPVSWAHYVPFTASYVSSSRCAVDQAFSCQFCRGLQWVPQLGQRHWDVSFETSGLCIALAKNDSARKSITLQWFTRVTAETIRALPCRAKPGCEGEQREWIPSWLSNCLPKASRAPVANATWHHPEVDTGKVLVWQGLYFWVSMISSIYSIEGTVPLSCQNLAGQCYSLLDTSLKYLGISGCSRNLPSSPDSSSERHHPGDFLSHRCQASQSNVLPHPGSPQRMAARGTDCTNHKE